MAWMGEGLGMVAIATILFGAPAGAARAQEPPPLKIAASDLEPGHRVEMKGTWEDDRVVHPEILLTRPDADVAWTVPLDGYDPIRRRGRALGRAFRLRTKVRLTSLHHKPAAEDALVAGSWWKLEGQIDEDGTLRVTKARQSKPRGRLKIVGRIASIEPAGEETLRLVVAGFPAIVRREEPVEVEEGIDRDDIVLMGVVIPSVLGRSDEDVLPGRIRLGDRVTLGGRFEVTPEFRKNFDVDTSKPDRTRIEVERLVLEGRTVLTRHLFGLVRGTFQTRAKHKRGNPDRTRAAGGKLTEGYLYAVDVFGTGIDLQVGRQDFDEPREWIYDENLDAVRLRWSHGPFRLEGSLSTFLSDVPNPVLEKVWQGILWAEYAIDRDQTLAAWILDRRDDARVVNGGLLDESPFFVGARWIGEAIPDVEHWVDAAFVTGVDGPNELRGYGLDAGATWVLDAPLDPALTLGYAFGSGDDDPTDHRDTAFRQTGLQDNNAAFHGVSSFRTYGEVLEPELSNLHLATAGLGIRPTRRTSIDLVGHVLAQVDRVSSVRSWNLRAKPNGEHHFLGQEVDLVFGFKEIRNLEIKAAGGVFFPGSGLDSRDPAYFVRVVFRYRF